jgi:hemerythrin-like domain-containing protein
MHPLYVLKHEHRVIERALRALDGVCKRLEAGEPVPTETLLALVEFMTDFACRYHHGKEENCLFPALHRQGIASRESALHAISKEHAVERNLTSQMREAAREYAEADPDSRALFAGAARAYINHLTEHIQREDSILFRVADEMLDDTDREDLMTAFERARKEFGPELIARYEQLATDLEQTWAE